MLTVLSLGKRRGLQQCSTPRGAFITLALDHRQNLRKANPAFEDDAQLIAFKLDVTRALASAATAVLLDPEYSAAQAIASGTLPGDRGLIIAVEATGYTGDPTARRSQILPGWSVAKAKRLGASMVKLLVYYHPDSPTAPEIESFVKQVAEDCAASELALMLEPLSYSLNSSEKKLSPAARRRVVIETARRLTPLGVDLLKAEFPADAAVDASEWVSACAELSAASATPWIVLSAAVDFETYLRQVRVACEAGASGIAVGRAVWQEAVSLTGEVRAHFLRDVARPRLARLSALCEALAKPWIDFYPAPGVEVGWYARYQ